MSVADLARLPRADVDAVAAVVTAGIWADRARRQLVSIGQPDPDPATLLAGSVQAAGAAIGGALLAARALHLGDPEVVEDLRRQCRPIVRAALERELAMAGLFDPAGLGEIDLIVRETFLRYGPQRGQDW